MPVSVCLYGGGHGAVFDLGIVLCFAEPAFAIMECRLEEELDVTLQRGSSPGEG